MSETHEDFEILLGLLRSEKLEWLAQEVNTAVEDARMNCLLPDEAEKDEMPLFRVSTARPWSEADELQTAIKVIHSRLVQPVQMWDAAEHVLKVGAQASLVMMDGEQTLREPFSRDVRQSAETFERALAELWPGGAEQFYAHFHEGKIS